MNAELKTVEPQRANTRTCDVVNAVRALAMDAVQKANSGHPGMPMGMAEIAEVLWRRADRRHPRDRSHPGNPSPHSQHAPGRPEKGMPNFDASKMANDTIAALYAYLKGRSAGAIQPGRLEEMK